MLHLNSIRLRDFGAFKGVQKIALSDEHGVSIVFGENMRGKTTLLNAIRFALFGKTQGRGTRQISMENLINWEARLEGETSCEVELRLTHAGADYKLTRTCKPRLSSRAAVNDDFVIDYFLERGGHLLSREQAAQELERILPEQIARFFLFDGELLQEYENLLDDESESGLKISQAIERILGLPTLIGARDSAKRALDGADTAVALAAQGDQKTREFGNQLQQLAAERQALTDDLLRDEKKQEDLKAERAAIEDAMKRQERLAALIDKRERLREEVRKTKLKLTDKEIELGKAMSPAWAAILRPRLVAASDHLRARETELQVAQTRAQVLKSLANGHDPECPTCLQKVDAKAQARISSLVKTDEAADGAAQQRELAAVRRRLDALNLQILDASPEALRLLWASLEEMTNEISGKEGEIAEITKQLSGDDEDDLRSLRRAYDSVLRQITETETGLKATQEALILNAGYRDAIQKRLDRLAGNKVEIERRKRDTISRLYDLYAMAVDVHRDALRKRVERDATAFFLAMTTEPDYSGLRINESYGLTILHKDGTPVSVRSAGAEHVVALSLVAALQNNAPLRGPIFIDSPFGRLDEGHRARVLEALPRMADQIMLFVYTHELPPEIARRALDGDLRGEWRLRRESARHTIIEKQ